MTYQSKNQIHLTYRNVTKRILTWLVVALSTATAPSLHQVFGTTSASTDIHIGALQGEPVEFQSDFLQNAILVFRGVFFPQEAEDYLLPYMRDHKELFKERSVLEIGVGSGLVSLYAAHLGAKRVVATDTDRRAIECTNYNAHRLGLDNVIDARLVSEADISAYSPLRENETFDIIISNPPYSLDLNAETTTTVTDTGELGLSLLRGLVPRMNRGGRAMLLYNSVFYHRILVKYARYLGHKVTDYDAEYLSPWSTEVIFNSYLARFAAIHDLPAAALRFDWRQESLLLKNSPQPGSSVQESVSRYPGLIVIEEGDDDSGNGASRPGHAADSPKDSQDQP